LLPWAGNCDGEFDERICGSMSGNRRRGTELTQTATKREPELAPNGIEPAVLSEQLVEKQIRTAIFVRLRSLLNQRQIIQRAALVGLCLGLILAFALPKRYESTTQLMPPDNQSTSGMAMLAALSAKSGAGLAPLAGDLLGVKSSGSLFIGILRSTTVEDRLIEGFDLRRVYGIKYWQETRTKLAENTGIGEDRKSGIITITVTDRDPKRAAAIAQAYVDELNQLVAELSTSSAHRERVFLEERLTSVKRDLDQASHDFSLFASKNKTIDIKEEARAMLQGAATIEGELIAAQAQLKSLQAIYTDNNVRVRSVQARIDELRRQMQKLGGGPADKPGMPLDAGDSTHPTLHNLPLLGVTYADLYRRMQIQETVYETLTQQFELAKVQEAKETPSVKVLDPAKVPEHKSYPPRLLIMLLCTFLGAIGATVFVLGKERWSEVGPQEPEKVFAREVFQVVNAKMPWAPPNGSRVQAMANRVWVKFTSRNGVHNEFHSDLQNDLQKDLQVEGQNGVLNGEREKPKDQR
jgi:capsule polysaccharide export protein KpsE/RkpR